MKFFLIALLGSASGNKLMLPSAAYSVEAGIQRGAFQLGVDLNYMAQEPPKSSFKQGNTSLLGIIPTLTLTPQIRSKLKPYVGIGAGYVQADRDYMAQRAGWKEWETLDSGIGYQFVGGLGYTFTKRVSVLIGVKQKFFQTKLREKRVQYPEYTDSIVYERVQDIELDSLTGVAGVEWRW